MLIESKLNCGHFAFSLYPFMLWCILKLKFKVILQLLICIVICTKHIHSPFFSMYDLIFASSFQLVHLIVNIC